MKKGQNLGSSSCRHTKVCTVCTLRAHCVHGIPLICIKNPFPNQNYLPVKSGQHFSGDFRGLAQFPPGMNLQTQTGSDSDFGAPQPLAAQLHAENCIQTHTVQPEIHCVLSDNTTTTPPLIRTKIEALRSLLYAHRPKKSAICSVRKSPQFVPCTTTVLPDYTMSFACFALMPIGHPVGFLMNPPSHNCRTGLSTPKMNGYSTVWHLLIVFQPAMNLDKHQVNLSSREDTSSMAEVFRQFRVDLPSVPSPVMDPATKDSIDSFKIRCQNSTSEHSTTGGQRQNKAMGVTNLSMGGTNLST